MDRPAGFSWLGPQDRATVAALDAVAPSASGAIRPEGLAVRLLAALAAPVWGSVVTVAALARMVRGRRPVVVLHRRVGKGRSSLWVPKLATLQIPGNRRMAAGLVELATGGPVEADAEGRTERWLRLTGIDELPQLALVVSGHMRLVGPRPVTPEELDEMARGGAVAVDRIEPGLLGVWQLLDRDGYTLAQRRELDDWMLDRWSPALRRRIVAIGARQALGRALVSGGPSGTLCEPLTTVDGYSYSK